MSQPTTTVDHLPVEIRDAISELLLQGRRVSEVIAHGLNRANGWRRGDVIDLVSARGWKLDSDGRIPRHFRTSAVVPIGTAPGAPTPAPGRPASWPEKGAVTPPPPDTADTAFVLIAQGKDHSVAKVRRLADKAETVLADLRAAIKAEDGREQLRRRLAELDAEAKRLRAQLGGPGRPPKTATGPEHSTDGKAPINHGTWGGFLAEKGRGLDICEACDAAKDATMAARKSARAS